MSALPARAATAGSLALALALALPAAAFADEEDRGRSEAGSSQGEQRSEERGRSQTAPHGNAEGASERDGKGGDESADKDGKADGGGKADEGRAAGGDPRGNNGTVKIDGIPFDDGRGNEPHVGCVFQVDFYGFDAQDTASITFTGQAPTGGGLLHSQTGTLISDDAAGGGQDRDATLTFSIDGQLSELKAIAPHPQQGWHVKLEVDVDSAPGGAKSKVFWIDCPQEAAAGGASTETETETDTEDAAPTTGTTTQGGGAGTVTTQGTTVGTVLPATLVSGTTVAAAERQELLALGAGEMTLGSGTTTLVAGEAAGESEVAAQGSVAPSALPFTGSAVLLYLLGLGASAVGVGAIAHRMGRQQADLV